MTAYLKEAKIYKFCKTQICFPAASVAFGVPPSRADFWPSLSWAAAWPPRCEAVSGLVPLAAFSTGSRWSQFVSRALGLLLLGCVGEMFSKGLLASSPLLWKVCVVWEWGDESPVSGAMCFVAAAVARGVVSGGSFWFVLWAGNTARKNCEGLWKPCAACFVAAVWFARPCCKSGRKCQVSSQRAMHTCAAADRKFCSPCFLLRTRFV